MSFRCISILLLALFISLFVCLRPATAQKSYPPAQSIRTVDFYNFTYFWPEGLLDPTDRDKTFRLKKGRRPETRFADGQVNEMGITLGKIVYGDVTGDEFEEAIIEMSILTGGTAQPNIVYIYTMKNRRPKLLWYFSTGDRADGGYRNAYAQNGRLVIELFNPEGSQGDCCPIKYTRTIYEWRETRFKPNQKQTFLIK